MRDLVRQGIRVLITGDSKRRVDCMKAAAATVATTSTQVFIVTIIHRKKSLGAGFHRHQFGSERETWLLRIVMPMVPKRGNWFREFNFWDVGSSLLYSHLRWPQIKRKLCKNTATRVYINASWNKNAKTEWLFSLYICIYYKYIHLWHMKENFNCPF